MSITEIEFKNGNKYIDDNGLLWTVIHNDLKHEIVSHVDFSSTFEQSIGELYTIGNIASMSFEPIT